MFNKRLGEKKNYLFEILFHCQFKKYTENALLFMK